MVAYVVISFIFYKYQIPCHVITVVFTDRYHYSVLAQPIQLGKTSFHFKSIIELLNLIIY